MSEGLIIGVSLTAAAVTMFVMAVYGCKLFKDNDTIKNLPTEADLKARDEERARKAFNTFTKGNKR